VERSVLVFPEMFGLLVFLAPATALAQPPPSDLGPARDLRVQWAPLPANARALAGEGHRSASRVLEHRIVRDRSGRRTAFVLSIHSDAEEFWLDAREQGRHAELEARFRGCLRRCDEGDESADGCDRCETACAEAAGVPPGEMLTLELERIALSGAGAPRLEGRVALDGIAAGAGADASIDARFSSIDDLDADGRLEAAIDVTLGEWQACMEGIDASSTIFVDLDRLRVQAEVSRDFDDYSGARIASTRSRVDVDRDGRPDLVVRTTVTHADCAPERSCAPETRSETRFYDASSDTWRAPSDPERRVFDVSTGEWRPARPGDPEHAPGTRAYLERSARLRATLGR
jgi:hypothetical protein